MSVYKHSGAIENVIKKYPTFWKNANFTGEWITQELFGLKMRNFYSIIFIWTQHVGKFSNLPQCTFNFGKIIQK